MGYIWDIPSYKPFSNWDAHPSSWSPTHRRPWCFKHFLAIFSFFDGLACQLAHRRHATLWLSWGGVGWGNNVHVNLHTHVMLRYCYVLLHLHTHVMLRYGDLLLHLLTHVMLRYGDLLLHLLTHVMLRYGDLLLHLHTHVMRTIVFADGNRAWESHAKSLKIKHAKVSHQNKEWTKQMRRTSFFSCPLWQGRKSLTDGGKAFPRRLYDGVNTKEHPELEKFVLGYCWRKSLGPLTPHRFLEELCKAVKAMKRF